MPDMRDWSTDQVIAWIEEQATKAGLPPGGATVSGSAIAKADRIRAVELAMSSGPAQLAGRSNQILSFINGETTTTLQTPLTRLLQACYNTFLAQDMADHVAVFDRVTDMRDAYGGVLAAMDKLGIPRPRIEGAVDEEADHG